MFSFETGHLELITKLATTVSRRRWSSVALSLSRCSPECSLRGVHLHDLPSKSCKCRCRDHITSSFLLMLVSVRRTCIAYSTNRVLLEQTVRWLDNQTLKTAHFPIALNKSSKELIHEILLRKSAREALCARRARTAGPTGSSPAAPPGTSAYAP